MKNSTSNLLQWKKKLRAWTINLIHLRYSEWYIIPASSDNKGSNTAEDTKGHGRNSADAYQGAAIVEVDHPELNPGDTCPAEACDGRLYEMSEPGTFVQVTGAPLASVSEMPEQIHELHVCLYHYLNAV